MANGESKYIKVGSIVKNTDKQGKEYQQLLLHKEFLDNAKAVVDLAYLDKQGNRRFSLFEPFEGAPDHIVWNVLVKKAE